MCLPVYVLACLYGTLLQTFYGSVIGSTLSRIILYPLDTIKINKQIHMNDCSSVATSTIKRHNNNYNATLGMSFSMKGKKNLFFFSFIKKYGLKGLYSGFLFSSVTTIPATSLYFCCFEYLKLKKLNYNKKLNEERINYEKDNSAFVHFVNYISLAFLAEAISCVIFVPIDVVKERLQTQKYLKLREYNKTYYFVRDLVRKEGLSRFYRGYCSTCLTYGLFGGSFFFFQNVGNKLMRKLEMEPSYSNNFKLNFICSMLSGIITSPLEVVRIRFQLQERNKTPFYYYNSFDGIAKLLREEGGSFFNLFKGNLYRCSLVCLSMTINVTIIDMYKKFVRISSAKGGNSITGKN
ncbi:mitochondrial carrier protein, putative [Plasmodium malariae]|uniref:Mitochondrial carrier protein, putative n=1 Tax=Plasmodium malariae TaxID=5858 RepID=A0A1C3K9L5_PLAMA|nr:mitochondrial carrier protein, putative [Plasmodium malariae]